MHPQKGFFFGYIYLVFSFFFIVLQRKLATVYLATFKVLATIVFLFFFLLYFFLLLILSPISTQVWGFGIVILYSIVTALHVLHMRFV